MTTNRKTAGCLLAAILLLGATGRADFKYTETSKVTGGAMAGMMKFAGVFSKQSRQAGAPTSTTQYLKGHKMRRDESDGQSNIIDLDGRQIISIDNNKRTYSVMSFDQMRQMIEQQKAKMQEELAKQDQKAAGANVKITPKVSVEEGPGSRTIAGQQAHEVKVNVEMLIEATDPNQPAQSGQVQSWVRSDEYVATDLPGADQFQEFGREMAKQLDWMPGEVFGGNAQVSMNMSALRKNSEGVKGFPLLRYVSMGMGAPGQPAAGASTSSSNDQQQTSGAPDTPGGAALKALGSLRGFHRHKKDQDQSDSNTSSGSAPAQASQPGSLIEMTVEVTAVSTDPLDSSLFGPPAGYQQVQPDFGGAKGASR